MKFQLVIGLFAVVSGALAQYYESLEVRPLARNLVLSTFRFEMEQTSLAGTQLQEFTSFPRSLGQILDRAHAHELHLRFGQGWWDADNWGSPPENGAYAGGIGVELWAWVEGKTIDEARANWHRLAHSLGGYFCASINFVDETQTTFPSEALLSPHGMGTENTWALRGALPAEPICTENLTPFLKLLPCKGKAGIASLLDGHSLFNSEWQTMSVDVSRPTAETIRLEQTVTNVLDTDRSRGLDMGGSPLPWHVPADKLKCDRSKPWSNDWTCFPVAPTSANYTLSSVFGSKINGRCPLAKSTEVKVTAPENWLVNGSPQVRDLDLRDDEQLDILLESESAQDVTPPHNSLLYVDRSFSGWGQQKGGIRTVYTNPGDTQITVHYLETLPWYMRVYLHTLEVYGAGELTNTRYMPSKDRARPTQLEFSFEIPAGAQIGIGYDFDKSLLFLEEYPPDANHGFEVPPGLAVAITPHGRYEVRTSSLLLSLPVPDFSMPYNVIILTSTVMSLAFGTIFNLIVRDVVPEEQIPVSERPFDILIAKIRRILRR